MVKKSTHRKEYLKEEYLPVKLTEKLQEDIFSNSRFEYRTKNNFLQCVAMIFYYQVTQGSGIHNYVPLGRNYWKKVYGGNYHVKVIAPLLELQIIESFDFGDRTFPDNKALNTIGKQEGQVGIRYRIKTDLLDEQYQLIQYIQKGKVLTATERMLLDNQEFINTGIPDLKFHVTIDQKRAKNWVEENAAIICNEFLKREYVKSLPEGLKIEYREYVEVQGERSYNVRYGSVSTGKMRAETYNLDFFYFNNSIYIDNVDEFLKHRIPALIYHYKHRISEIGTVPVVETRSPVTLRLYSNLTNFPSRILQFIKINNKTVVQLDLRTSQFLIFANLLNVYINHGEQHLQSLFKQEVNLTYLKKLVKILRDHKEQLPDVGVDIWDNNSGRFSTSDVTMFIRDVFFTDFYDVVQKELGLQDRLLAKHVLFKLLFKKTNRPDELISKLSKRYPVVMNIIAAFKKRDLKPKAKKKTDIKDDDHESNFSVFLQCIEGEIFVDNILRQLRENDIPCFTRHDSLVVADGHENKAEEIAKNFFKQLGFRYNHKVEDKFWEVIDYEELEESDYMQWVIDEELLNTDFSIENSLDEKSDNNYDMDEQHLATIERLREIGVQDNYFGKVDAEFLEEISELPFLTQKQRNILYDDINNLHDGLSFLQANTEELLRYLAK